MQMNNKMPQEDLEYKDVFIIPQYTEITSRKLVDTSVYVNEKHINQIKLDVPIMTANMDSVTETEMAIAAYKAGGIGCMHRFMTIEENVTKYLQVKESDAECFVSVGITEESKERVKALYDVGARYFVIDIAHGHSKMMKDMLIWMRNEYKEKSAYDRPVIMAGNVATPLAVIDLKAWGADIAKVGIGPGKVCTTKNVTGVTRPQFSAVLDCAKGILPIVADGGISEIGDICKAIAAGASFVMIGNMFASCEESPGTRSEDGKTKIYRGMASKDAMLTIRADDETLPTPEGKVIEVQIKGTTKQLIKDIKGGLQSSMSYTNAINIKQFQNKVKFGVRYNYNP